MKQIILALGAFICLCGLLLLSLSYLVVPAPTDASITEVTGTFSRLGEAGEHDVVIWLREYNAPFYINRGYEFGFEKEAFITSVLPGEAVTVLAFNRYLPEPDEVISSGVPSLTVLHDGTVFMPYEMSPEDHASFTIRSQGLVTILVGALLLVPYFLLRRKTTQTNTAFSTA